LPLRDFFAAASDLINVAGIVADQSVNPKTDGMLLVLLIK